MPTFDTPRPIAATIDAVAGEIRVRASDRDTTVVEVVPTDPADDEDVRAAENARVELVDGRLTVRAPKLRSWLTRHGGSIDVAVDLPSGSDLEATVGLGDIRAEGRYGDVRVRTGLGRVRVAVAATLHLRCGAGDVLVDRVEGHAEITSASGKIRVGELAGTGVVKNSNGATWVGAAHDELRIQAANGAIAVDLAGGGLVAKSANGNIRVEEVVRRTVVLETHMGDIEVGLRPGTAAWLDVQARAGGVRNDLDAADAPSDGDTASETVEVRARTTLGQIVIRRPRGATDVH